MIDLPVREGVAVGDHYIIYLNTIITSLIH